MREVLGITPAIVYWTLWSGFWMILILKIKRSSAQYLNKAGIGVTASIIEEYNQRVIQPFHNLIV